MGKLPLESKNALKLYLGMEISGETHLEEGIDGELHQ